MDSLGIIKHLFSCLITQDCCKHDETMEHLLDTVSSLLQALDSPETKVPNPLYTMLPDSMGLHDQFNGRLVFYVTEDDDERVTTGMWLGLPSLDELDTEPEMVRTDIHQSKVCPHHLPPHFSLSHSKLASCCVYLSLLQCKKSKNRSNPIQKLFDIAPFSCSYKALHTHSTMFGPLENKSCYLYYFTIFRFV